MPTFHAGEHHDVHALGAYTVDYREAHPFESAEITHVAADIEQRGSIACVGLGMTLGSHLTPLARNHIEQADVIFAALSDGMVEMWLEQMHADVRSLQPSYGEGKSCLRTYREWVD